MSKRKLIWDFRGPDAKGIAEHYKIHLDEFAQRNNLDSAETGVEEVTGMYCTAYFFVDESAESMVWNALRPHRAE